MSDFSLFSDLVQEAKERDVRRQAQAEAERIKNDQLLEDRKAAQALARMTQQHGYFVEGFKTAMKKLMIDGGWHGAAVELAAPYCEALVKFDGELHELNKPLKRIIDQKFAYGVFLAGDKLPSDLMVGQRQESIQEEITKLQATKTKLQATKTKGPSFKAKPAPAEFPSDETVPFASSESTGYGDAIVIKLPDAITPRKATRGTKPQATKKTARSRAQQTG